MSEAQREAANGPHAFAESAPTQCVGNPYKPQACFKTACASTRLISESAHNHTQVQNATDPQGLRLPC
eukprot:24614-Pelagomonas_calceolata.AAC.2